MIAWNSFLKIIRGGGSNELKGWALEFAWIAQRDFPEVHWLRLHAPNAGGQGSIPGRETRPHMPQQRPGVAK